MKKIYICRAIGTKCKSLVRIRLLNLIFFFGILVIAMITFMDSIPEIVDKEKIQLMFGCLMGIGITYHNFYIVMPPYLQIDSLNGLIYKGRRECYSTKLKDIHHFSITDNSIILHSKKVIRIPFSEFENIDLINFANIINQIIETNMNFSTIFVLVKDKKIPDFYYFEGQSIKQIYKQDTVITKFSQYGFPMIGMIILTIMISLIELARWFFL